MDTSKFNLWRACFSFCQIDSKLAEQERKWLEDKAGSLKLSAEEKKTLLNDINNPPDLTAILPLITKPSDRAFLVDQMRVLAYIDGNLSPVEKAKIDEVKTLVLSKINLTELEQKIAEDEMSSYHEDEVYKVDNESSFFERLHRYAQKVINPGDYKLPK